MDRHYRWQRLIYDATRTHYLIGRVPMLRGLEAGAGQSVLEVGCGTAWNLIRSAVMYPQVQHFGFDVSSEMLKTARGAVNRHRLSGRIVLAQGDAVDFNPLPAFGRSCFDRVFISYALSMIPCWQDALRHSATLVAPGGSLHIVEFGPCDELPPAFKAAFYRFLGHYTVHPRSDLEAYAESVAQANQFELRFERLHRGFTVVAVLTRRLNDAALSDVAG
jgi:S-adenosylmethionine-diacylgycerolhomoserine-N-methlytransferase